MFVFVACDIFYVSTKYVCLFQSLQMCFGVIFVKSYQPDLLIKLMSYCHQCHSGVFSPRTFLEEIFHEAFINLRGKEVFSQAKTGQLWFSICLVLLFWTVEIMPWLLKKANKSICLWP